VGLEVELETKDRGIEVEAPSSLERGVTTVKKDDSCTILKHVQGGKVPNEVSIT